MLNFNRNQLVAAYVIVGFAVVGMLVFGLRSGLFASDSAQVKLIEPGAANSSPQASATASSTPAELCIHVSGCVKKPGVCKLKPGSRVMDAIQAAGGASEKADLESINLAAKLEDGQQVYVAEKGKIQPPKASVVRGGKSEAPRPVSAGSSRSGSKGTEKLKKPGQGMVNINTAGMEELQRLSGIGPAMAQRILDYRKEHGRFQSADELDEVKGIGPKKLEKLRPFVTL